jgi:small subunit ribosomal protein S23
MNHVQGITEEQAYDAVRREFYALRQEEEVERRIAQEEARMVGAYFGKTPMQIGMELEDQQFEEWKKWAVEETMKIEAERSQAYTSFGDDSKDPDLLEEDLARAK